MMNLLPRRFAHFWILAVLAIATVTYAQDADAPSPATPVPAGAVADAAATTAAPAQQTTYFDELVDKIRKGGMTMVILLALSVVGIGYILERLVNLNRKSIATPGLADQANTLYRAGKFDELHALCRADKSALARIILAVVDHRDCERNDIQTLAGDIGSRVMRVHLQKAYPLAIISTLAPLLGLLGTIIGMIGAFGTVASVGEMGDASILADDIAKALVTTAGGLIVAIPMLGFYHYFRSRTNAYAVELEEDVGELFSAWFLRPAAAATASAAAAPSPDVTSTVAED